MILSMTRLDNSHRDAFCQASAKGFSSTGAYEGACLQKDWFTLGEA